MIQPSLDEKERQITLSMIEYLYWIISALFLLACVVLFYLWWGSDASIFGIIVGIVLPGALFYPKMKYKELVDIRTQRQQKRDYASIKYEPGRSYERIPVYDEDSSLSMQNYLAQS